MQTQTSVPSRHRAPSPAHREATPATPTAIRSKRRLAIVTALLGAAALAAAPVSAQNLVSVAETRAPDTTSLGPGYFYTWIGPDMVIDDAGLSPHIVFRAVGRIPPQAGGPLVRRGVVVDVEGAPGSGVVVAEQRGASPDGGLYTRLQQRPYFDQPGVNGFGQAAWLGRTLQGWVGVFSGFDPLNAVDVALGDDETNLPGGERLRQIFSPSVLAGGEVVFAAKLRNGSIDAGYFLCETPGTCSTVAGAVTSQHIPLVVEGDIFPDGEVCRLNRTVTASAWGIAFTGRTAPVGECGTAAEDQAAFRMAYGGPIEVLARSGEPAEPTEFNKFFGRLNRNPLQLAISDAGHVAIQVELSGVTRGHSIYLCDPALDCPASAAPFPIAQDNMPAPAGGSFMRFSRPAVSSAGEVAFQATLRAGPRQGIYRWTDQPAASGCVDNLFGPGSVCAVAVRGEELDSIEGQPADIVQLRHAPVMSPNGAIAFLARLRIPGSGRPTAILAYQ